MATATSSPIPAENPPEETKPPSDNDDKLKDLEEKMNLKLENNFKETEKMNLKLENKILTLEIRIATLEQKVSNLEGK